MQTMSNTWNFLDNSPCGSNYVLSTCQRQNAYEIVKYELVLSTVRVPYCNLQNRSLAFKAERGAVM